MPKYRLEFFERLVASLDGDGIICRVSAGSPTPSQAIRGDVAEANWIIPTTLRRTRVLGRSFGSSGSGRARRSADAVIVALQGSSLDTYGALFARYSRHTRAGVWGHVKSYVNDPHPVDQLLERQQALQADHVFAYTPGGTKQAIDWGVPIGGVTTVMNSVDVCASLHWMGQLQDEQVTAFQAEHHIDPKNSACFIGGLDHVKRVGFLQSALDEIWSCDKSFKLIVGGNGVEADLLRPSVQRGQVVMLGFAGPREKALLAKSSTVLAMPGRVGLVAVECLALGLPVITTNWPYHAPEIEYLQEGTTLFLSANDPVSYAETLLEQVKRCAAKPTSRFDYPTLDSMVANFRTGVHRMLA